MTLVALAGHNRRGVYALWMSQWGWPFRCLESESHAVSSTTGSSLPPMPWPLRPLAPANGFLLMCPVWRGFAVNTTFYAAILWLLIPGPFALRRFLRVRRGLCPKCAYPMGESSVCTECGCELPKRGRTT